MLRLGLGLREGVLDDGTQLVQREGLGQDKIDPARLGIFGTHPVAVPGHEGNPGGRPALLEALGNVETRNAG